jgi:acyl-CoA reductase-like NAD-dependent aldehyde dehydrogenase
VNEANERDVVEAVAAAKEAFPVWEKSAPQFKVRFLRNWLCWRIWSQKLRFHVRR